MANRKRKAEVATSLESSNSTKKTTLSSKIAQLSDESDESTKENTSTICTHHAQQYWLMKSEPESRIENGHEMKFSVDDLKSSPAQTTHWDGVRNYEARNHMRAMRTGDRAFFYHSNCKNPGLIAVMRICKEAYVDHTQFDPAGAHYDPKSDKSAPRWFMVDVKFERDLKRFIPLAELKHYYMEHKKNDSAKRGPLANLSLFTRSRLSVQAITQQEWDFIIDLENKPSLK